MEKGDGYPEVLKGLSQRGPLRKQAEALLETFCIEILVLRATHDRVTPEARWSASRTYSGLSLSPLVAVDAAAIAMSPQREAEEVLRLPWNAEDPQNEHARTRLDLLCGELWGDVLWAAAQSDENIEATVSAVAGVVGEPLAPFSPLFLLINPKAPRVRVDALTARIALEANLVPTSRVTRPAALLVPTTDRAGAEGFLNELPEPAIRLALEKGRILDLFHEVGLVLAEALVVSLRDHAQKSRATEESTLIDRTPDA